MCTVTRRRVIQAGFGGLAIAFVGASQPRRKKRRLRDFPPFPIGAEGVISINGDEARVNRALGKAGILRQGSLVLPLANDEYGDVEEAIRVSRAYREALEAADPDGVDRLLKQGDVINVKAGTKVRVVKTWPGGLTVWGGLPCD
jgi:hypothetical protein